jgi:hypothetical protein
MNKVFKVSPHLLPAAGRLVVGKMKKYFSNRFNGLNR